MAGGRRTEQEEQEEAAKQESLGVTGSSVVVVVDVSGVSPASLGTASSAAARTATPTNRMNTRKRGDRAIAGVVIWQEECRHKRCARQSDAQLRYWLDNKKGHTPFLFYFPITASCGPWLANDHLAHSPR
jgi:hypothetical protein